MTVKKLTETKQESEKVATTPSVDNFPSVRKGDKGGFVTLVQTNLMNRGYDIGKEGVDGKFGEKTLKALKEFQKDTGMPVPNGIVGPKTWERLMKSNVVKVRPAEPKPVQQQASSGGVRVVIEGLSRYQADLLIKLLQGHTECRII